MRHGAGSFRQHGWLDFGFYRDPELSVLSLIERRTVNAVSDAVLLGSVEREADFFIRKAAAPMRGPRSVSLQGYHGYTALIAGGVAAVAVERP